MVLKCGFYMTISGQNSISSKYGNRSVTESKADIKLFRFYAEGLNMVFGKSGNAS